MKYKYNIVYKTTNLINNKIYIGVHGTNNLNDGYLGTGRLIKKAIKKYGKESFKREILYIFDDPDEAYEKEKELVNESFVKNPKTYNLFLGGFGGRKNTIEEIDRKRKWYHDNKNKIKYKRGKDHHCYGIKLSKERCEAISERMKGKKNPMYQSGENHSMYKRNFTKQHRKNISYGNIGEKEHKKRLNDIENAEKSYGWMAKLSKKWGVSNRTGLMFIKKWYPDYKPRIIHPDKFCKCGKKIGHTTTKCMSCHNDDQRNPILVNMVDNDFRNLVWSKPISKICEEFKSTATAIKRMAKRRDIDLPPRGYWATGKNQYNKNMFE